MPGRRTDVEIGDNTYHILPFEPFLSLEVLGELQKYLLGPVTRMIEAAQADAGLTEATTAIVDGGDDAPAPDLTVSVSTMRGIMEGIDKLSANLDGKTLVRLARLVLNPEYVAVSIDGGTGEKLTQVVANRAFGDIGEMAQLIVEVVKANYEGFIKRSLALIGQGQRSTPAKRSASSLLN